MLKKLRICNRMEINMLNTKEIMDIIPHRQPFLLVDRIEEMEVGKRAVGIKCVSYNEPFFAGHFPDQPVMPGVLIIEAMAQVELSVYYQTINIKEKLLCLVELKTLNLEEKLFREMCLEWKWK